MDCKTAHSMIHEFLDGTLGPDRARSFKAHAAECPACAREIEGYRALERRLRAVEPESPPAGFAEPVVRFLKATGRIRAGEVGAEAGRRGAGLAGWIPARLRVPAVAAALLIAVLATISIGSGRFVGFLGKSTVAATTTYIGVQRTVSKVAILDDVSEGLEQDVRKAKTLANAAYLLISFAGHAYVMPAVLMLLAVTLGAAWYIRFSARRSAGHASYCF